jgi:hypothetical protein
MKIKRRRMYRRSALTKVTTNGPTQTLPCSWQPVLTKRDFVRRYAAGEFGNASPTWTRLEQFAQHCATEESWGLYHLRNGVVAGGVTYYKQERAEALWRWANVERPGDWYCSVQVPPEVEAALVIQGEVQQAMGERCGLDLSYTRVAKPMRTALREDAHSVSGIMALSLLQVSLSPCDYDWLNVLLDRYPQHVIEFSAYTRRWGTLDQRTIIWEVRNY